MGHENFPLVVFDQTAPLSIPEGESDAYATGGICRGIGCLVGSRQIEMEDRQLGMVPLLPAGPTEEERVPLDHRIGTGKEVEGNDSLLGVGDGAKERTQYDMKWTVVSGFIALTMVLALAIFRFGRKKVAVGVLKPVEVQVVNGDVKEMEEIAHPPSDPMNLSIGSSPGDPPLVDIAARDEKPLPEPPVAEISREESSIPPVGPKSATPKEEAPQDQPVTPTPADDAEEVDDSDKEDAVGTPRRKRPPRRKRGKKKKAGAEHDEEGKEKEKEDVPSPILVPSPAPAAIPPPMAVPSGIVFASATDANGLLTPSLLTPRLNPSQLTVSETVLGMDIGVLIFSAFYY